MSLVKDERVLTYVQNEILQPSEKLAWRGRPSPGRAMRLDILHFFIGLFWLTFSIFWVVMASVAGAFALFGVPFVLIGIWLVSTPIRNLLRAGRTYYAITNRRVLIVTAGSRIKVRSLGAHDIGDNERSDRGDGTGDIRLRKGAMASQMNYFFHSSLSDGLWGIDDIKGAADAIASVSAE